jgi:serine/threonine-protein kinase RsbW
MTDAERTLRVTAELANLAEIRRFVRLAAESAGAAGAAAWDLVQAVDESATNTIVHGFHGRPGNLEVRVRVEAGRLVVRLSDDATPFDPTTVPPPDLDLPLDRRPLGGMGVQLTRDLTDEVRYRAPASGGNELTLIKRIPRDGARPRPVEQEA